MNDLEANAAQQAHNYTAKGINGLIQHSKDQLAELDACDKEFGENGEAVRAEARVRFEIELRTSLRALEIRQAVPSHV